MTDTTLSHRQTSGATTLNVDQLRMIVEQLPAVLWTTDRELRFTSSFGAGLVRLGLKPGQVVGMSLHEFFQTDDPEYIVLAAHRRVLAGESVSFEVEWLGNSYDVHVEPLRNEADEIVGCIGVAQDVTLRCRAEHALRQRIETEALTIDISRRFAGTRWEDIGPALRDALEQMARHLDADHADIALASADGQWYRMHHRWDDPELERLELPDSMPGYAFNWLIRQLAAKPYLLVPDLSTFPELIREDAPPDLRNALSGAWIGIRMDGRVIGGIGLLWRRKAADITDAQIAPLTVLADVIATLIHRQTIEERLNESRRMMSALMSNLPGMAYRCRNDRNWTIEFVSDGCRDLTGYTADELIGNRVVSYADLIVPDDRAMVWHDVQEGVNNESTFRSVYRIADRHGTIKWVWEQGTPMYDGNGSVTALEGFIADISERKYAEIERQKFVSLVENSSDGVIMCSLDGRTLYMNPAGRALLGIPRQDDVSDRSMVNWYCERYRNEHPEAHLIEAKRTGQWVGEVALTHQDTGDSIPVRQNVFLVRKNDDEPLCIAVLIHDLREEKHADELLMRAKRLETAGQLAGQIAHDFNNLLGPLVAYPNLIRSRVGDVSGIDDMLRDMEEAANRIAEINQELLTLGRRGHYNVQALDINQLIGQTLRTTTIPERVTVAKELKGCLAPVLGGGAQLIRAFSNIIVNSCDAMSNGGTLTVRTSECRIDGKHLRGRTVPAGEYVRIDIADSGHGIPSEIINRVFDPFFTTRKADKGRGSGLGLAVVYSVIEDHEGYVDVTSTPGVGTTFSIYLPVSEDAAESSTHTDNVPRGHDERVLVVDDDLMQLRIIERMLRDLKYDVTTVDSGEAAVERTRHTDFDLLLLDMQMNGIDGAETFRQIRRHNPHQRAVIVSGYAGTERVASALASGVSGFIQKPVDVASLARMVRQALSGKPATNSQSNTVR
ncbi:MAG: PAS domain S-box protein [candidate division Zixibacteria bacterium]|nr:PAS domain S-box protein [candidate division Zixibacteria bacterium]